MQSKQGDSAEQNKTLQTRGSAVKCRAERKNNKEQKPEQKPEQNKKRTLQNRGEHCSKDQSNHRTVNNRRQQIYKEKIVEQRTAEEISVQYYSISDQSTSSVIIRGIFSPLILQ